MKLYHRVPDNLKYEDLMPLNQLEEIDQELFEHGNWKYLHRPHLKKCHIPTLDCLWNDVIFMSPVHPFQLKQALENSGIRVRDEQDWFEICPKECDFNSTNSTIYMYSDTESDNSDLSEYSPFSIDKLKSLVNLRPEVVKYYKECASNGIRPMVFHLVPHVMYQGKLPINKLSVIRV